MTTPIQFVPANTQLFSRVHAYLANHYIAPMNVFGPGKLNIALGTGESKEAFFIQISAQKDGVLINMRLSINALKALLSEPQEGEAVTPILYQLLPQWFPSASVNMDAWSAMKVTAFHADWTPELSLLLDNAMRLNGIPAVWRGN